MNITPSPSLSRRGLLGAAAVSGLGLACTQAPRATAQGVGQLPSFVSTQSAIRRSWGQVVGERSASVAPDARPAGALFDGEGVIQFRAADGKVYYHPLMATNRGRDHLITYRRTRDPRSLEMARIHARRLVGESVSSRGAMWLPYRFAWTPHGPDLGVPWYFGMTQGVAVGFMAGMWMTTGETLYRDWADELFASTLLPHAAPGTPWIAGVDARGHLWLDEYPLQRTGELTQVYNGHCFGAIGLIRYWDALLAAGDTARAAQVKAVIDGALTTAFDYRNAIRTPGNAASYFVSRSVPTDHYHPVHTQLMDNLFEVTGSTGFLTSLDALVSDFPDTQGPGTVVFQPGTYTLYQFDRWGRVTQSRVWKNLRTTTAPASRRWGFVQNYFGRGKTWLQVCAGWLSGWYIEQQPGKVYYAGMTTDVHAWAIRRPVRFAGGVPITARAYDASGSRVLRTVTNTFRSTSVAHSDRRSCIQGRQMIHIVDGLFAGMWVQEGAAAHHA